ncbi:hypothetical protein [Candidatus Thiosymbion oneisti]|uniref:hypothetical protein n=1 Tax=Candidatus Thiosymbion oneisti TaxID=589554 RepID=UPI00114CC3A7|nr:hypothetical protein [Candidatus Thiosymbion oneisti]
MDNFIELIKILVWPVVVIWIVYLFKSNIDGLFSRLSYFKYKDAEAKFENELNNAEVRAEKIKRSELKDRAIISKQEQLERIAEISPRAAIMEAWVMIETAGRNAGIQKQIQFPGSFPQQIRKHLGKQLSEESMTLIDNLLALRNKAAHLPEFTLSAGEAKRYLAMSSIAAGVLENAKGS